MPQDPTHELGLRLASSPSAPLHARHAIVEFLGRVGRSDLADDATLLVDELVTNAVQHASGAIEVTANYLGRALRVEVQDSSPGKPIVREPDVLDETGRGLRLVAILAECWAIERQDNGNRVWFQLT